MTNQILTGHVLEVLRGLPAESIHCVVTSPPYWNLRDYGTEPQAWGGDPECKHRWEERGYYVPGGGTGRSDHAFSHPGTENADRLKRARTRKDAVCRCGAWRGNLGLEPDPQDYIEHLVGVFREVRRVLRPDGTLWLNIGDSYAANRSYQVHQTKDPEGHTFSAGAKVPEGLKPKDLCMIPARLALALQADGWWIRCDGIWAKPNPLPEAVKDRPARNHEYVFLLTKNERYYYDHVAVMEPCESSPSDMRKMASKADRIGGRHKVLDDSKVAASKHTNVGRKRAVGDPSGRNCRSVWTIPTTPFPDAHFAVFPEDLVIPCVLAGTSDAGVCPECGAQWVRRIHEEYVKSPAHGAGSVIGRHYETGQNNYDGAGMPRLNKLTRTIDWTPSCGCGTGLKPDDLEIIESPTGRRTDDPSLETARAGLARPRDGEGTRPMTRWEQRSIAEQLRKSPYRKQMEEEAGPAFSHYIRKDRTGARPVPKLLLDAWLERGWVRRQNPPIGKAPKPVPATVLDPFMGSGTTGVVARRLRRNWLGIELNPEYARLAEGRIKAAPPRRRRAKDQKGQKTLF